MIFNVKSFVFVTEFFWILEKNNHSRLTPEVNLKKKKKHIRGDKGGWEEWWPNSKFRSHCGRIGAKKRKREYWWYEEWIAVQTLK